MRAFRALLWCYPAAFRHEYGKEMALVFAEQWDRQPSLAGRAALWASALRDAIMIGPKEHAYVSAQDLQYTWRTMKKSPGFAAVAILSLALGIGANSAIFSMWNKVMIASLPVPDPDKLVMLSDPASSGTWTGSSNGERNLLTYAEFEQLRDQVPQFAGVMASESSLNRWPARIGDGAWSEVRGRLVSGTFFEVLGARPLMGRFPTAADDRAVSPVAVVSYDYWRRALGGRPDVLGQQVTVRKAALTIIGVAPPEFTGETASQRPDLWVTATNAPGVYPGRDWLHDTGVEKTMWLHVFARLQPGVSPEQAQAAANAVFKNGLAAYYGASVSPEKAREMLDQRLVVRPAATGASRVRAALGDPLLVLMAAVGAVLLIACCNLANLLLARGVARRAEIALRLSLGATRARLVRQLLTESAVLALAGGAAGIAVAYAVHALLVRMYAASDETLSLGFGLEPRVILFSMAVTLVAAAVCGVLPALLATRAQAAQAMQSQGRGGSASGGQMRWGRAVVALQLALTVPLLAGAALLARTLSNLKNVDLGYEREKLMVARVDLSVAGYELPRRLPLIERLLSDIRRLPGVSAASYSENGLFSGNDSGDDIEVEGYIRKGNDTGSRWDQVGPDYFATVGMPIVSGRGITAADHAGAPKVCVINEAFARKFFEGRNPLGRRITTVYGDRRPMHQVVGVARDARTHRLRGDVQPRYFAPLSQPLGENDAIVFLVRTAAEPGGVIKSLQQTIRRADPELDILHAEPVDTRIARRLVQDGVMARLAACFGIVAMLLAALGLYGVLSHSVARRRPEIGIRIALGAQPARVVAMILREAAGTWAPGLAIGLVLAYAGTAAIRSLLYGVEPNDPATLAAAAAVLAAVACAAAYLPARRAAAVAPMAVLRQE